MIITKTPYRLSLFGGGTDYKSWYESQGGLVVGAALEKYCYITLRKLEPFFEHKTRVVYSKTELVRDHREIQHPGVRECLGFLEIQDGLEIHHDGDLPAKSGIGSSSSFTVGLLLALHTYQKQKISMNVLAREAIFVEQHLIQEPVGIQDQILSAYGGIQVIEMGPQDQWKVSPLILSEGYQEDLQRHLLLAFTGVTRVSHAYAQAQIEKITHGKNDQYLKEIYHIALEGKRLLSQQADPIELARLIHASWNIKRQLADQVSNPQIDELYAAALKAGALGGRLLGAGGGGFFLFVVPPQKQNELMEALGGRVKAWVPVKFSSLGAQVLMHSDQNRVHEWHRSQVVAV